MLAHFPCGIFHGHNFNWHTHTCIWRFPKEGVPLHHPFYTIFYYKPPILGYPCIPISRHTHIYIYRLVVWNMTFIFPSYWECHHPNWLSLIFFRGVGIPPTSIVHSRPQLHWTGLKEMLKPRTRRRRTCPWGLGKGTEELGKWVIFYRWWIDVTTIERLKRAYSQSYGLA